MITYLLIQFSNNTYTLVDRRISRCIGIYHNLYDLIKATQYVDYANRFHTNWENGIIILKTSSLKHIVDLPHTHPEFFI